MDNRRVGILISGRGSNMMSLVAAAGDAYEVVLVASDNPMFVTVAAPICETLRGRAALGLTPAVPAPSAMQGHLGTARAVRQRDPDAAEQCTRAYISTIWQEIVES